MTNTVPRCAVVFKTYAWDGFVERQARRLAEAAGALDFYISVDETNGPVGPIAPIPLPDVCAYNA